MGNEGMEDYVMVWVIRGINDYLMIRGLGNIPILRTPPIIT